MAKRTHIADAGRVKRWLRTGYSGKRCVSYRYQQAKAVNLALYAQSPGHPDMLGGILALLLCRLAGGLMVVLTGLPIPGAVLGMVLLLLLVVLRVLSSEGFDKPA